MNQQLLKICIILAAFLSNGLGAACFFGLSLNSLFFSLVFTPLLAAAFFRLQAQRTRRRARKDLMNFLQYLCSRLASGQSLRSALKNTPQFAFGGIGGQPKQRQIYTRIAAAIHAQQASAEFIPLLYEAFPCPEAESLLFALRMEERLGDRLLGLLRDACDTARELVLLEEEMQAAAARSRAEAFILSLIPFALAPLFRSLVHLPPGIAFGTLSEFLRALACGLASAALSLHFYLAADGKPGKTRKRANVFLQKVLVCAREKRYPDVRNPYLLSYGEKLIRRYRLIHPEYFYVLDNEHLPALLRLHLQLLLRNTSLCALICCPLFIIAAIPLYWLPLIPSAFCLLSEAHQLSAAEEHERELRKDLPLLLALLAQLLKNGLSLNNALAQCAELFSSQASTLSLILRLIEQNLRQAESASSLLEKLAFSLKLSDIGSALLMLSRFVQLGGRELLQLLEKQLSLCWAEQRQQLRRNLDARSGLLLLPMLLDLLAVMLIGVAPALSIFSVL